MSIVVVVIVVEDVGDDQPGTERQQAGGDHRAGAVAFVLRCRFGRRRCRSRGSRRGHRCGRGRRRGRVGRHRVVRWHVDHLRARRGDHDRLLAVLRLFLDLHLRRALQVADVLRLLAQPLHGREDAGLVVGEGLAELARPTHLEAHLIDDLAELHERAHRWREARLFDRLVERLALDVRVRHQPVAGVEHFLRVRRRQQNLGQHGIRIEGDGRQQGLQGLGRPALIGGRQRLSGRPGFRRRCCARRGIGLRRIGRRRDRGCGLLLRAATSQHEAGQDCDCQNSTGNQWSVAAHVPLLPCACGADPQALIVCPGGRAS